MGGGTDSDRVVNSQLMAADAPSPAVAHQQLRGGGSDALGARVADKTMTLSEKEPPTLQLKSDNATRTRNAKSMDSISNHQQPFMYYTNPIGLSSHHFSLHSHPNTLSKDNTSSASQFQQLYSNYGTTLTIIFILHIIYFIQWNRRSSRKDVCTSYDQIVGKKQFYKVAIALASHPPVDGGERDMWRAESDVSDNNTLDGGNGDHRNNIVNDSSGLPGRPRRFIANSIFSNRIASICQRICYPVRQIYKFLHPLIFGSLSGLPLLAFVSHILWQCRALEELYDEHDGRLLLGVSEDETMARFSGIGTHGVLVDSTGASKTPLVDSSGITYTRVLVALALTSVLLELTLLRTILRRMDRYIDFSGMRTTPQQLLSQRAMCSFTAVTAALLSVYDAIFPYAPLPVLPFVRASFLSSSGFSLLFSITVLMILSHRIHPITSVVSGLLSGSLWSLGLTSFLGTRYWSNGIIVGLMLVMLFSLKSNPEYSVYLEKTIPCLDYVGWDSEGHVCDLSSSYSTNTRQDPRRGSSQLDNNDGDLELGRRRTYSEENEQQSSSVTERRSLLSRADSSMSGGGSIIRGRLPFSQLDSDLEDDSAEPMPASRPDNLSRRSRAI